MCLSEALRNPGGVLLFHTYFEPSGREVLSLLEYSGLDQTMRFACCGLWVLPTRGKLRCRSRPLHLEQLPFTDARGFHAAKR